MKKIVDLEDIIEEMFELIDTINERLDVIEDLLEDKIKKPEKNTVRARTDRKWTWARLKKE